MFGGEFPHPLGEPVSCDRSAHPGQVLREQQGDVAVGALLRHPDIGEVVVCVDHGDTLGPDLGNQAGQVGHPGGEEPPLPGETAELGVTQLVVVEHRIVQESAGERLPHRAEAQLVAVEGGFGDEVRHR